MKTDADPFRAFVKGGQWLKPGFSFQFQSARVNSGASKSFRLDLMGQDIPAACDQSGNPIAICTPRAILSIAVSDNRRRVRLGG